MIENEADRAAAVADLKGWDRLFGVPEEAVGHANQFGFRAGDYAQDGSSWLTTGSPVTVSQSDATMPNTATFEGAGISANALDRIVFTLAITDPANADTAKTRFADIVRQFLSQYAIKDGGALDAIAAEESADGVIDAVPVSIAVAPGDGENRTITVTFTRPAASTPGNPQAQG
ncbi:hypothetical protein [Sphingomonas japonica]|uniref:hypothetical protein n=1 Tax=Sphingomonas japonica TaxID=511662 RepID=UPI0031CDBA42